MTATSATSTNSALDSATVIRITAAAALLVGGLVHLQLYFDGYRSFPDANLGRSFVANGIASVLIAAALLVRRDVVVRLAGIGLALSTLAAFAMSRRGDGVFGLRETGLNPSPQALIALIAEIGAVAALAISFVPKVGGGNMLAKRAGLAGAALCGVGAIVLSILWSQDPADTSTAAPAETTIAATDSSGSSGSSGSSAVTISGFEFVEAQLTVAAGTEVLWTNADGPAHSVVATDGSFSSDRLGTGDSFGFTFDAAGTFDCVCGIHSSMTGTVIVTE